MNEYFSVLGTIFAGLYLLLAAIVVCLEIIDERHSSGIIYLGPDFGLKVFSAPAAYILTPYLVVLGLIKAKPTKNFGRPSFDIKYRHGFRIFFLVSCLIMAFALYSVGYAISNLFADTKTAVEILLAVTIFLILAPLFYYKVWLHKYRLAGKVRIYDDSGYLEKELRYVGKKQHGLQKVFSYGGNVESYYYMKDGKTISKEQYDSQFKK